MALKTTNKIKDNKYILSNSKTLLRTIGSCIEMNGVGSVRAQTDGRDHSPRPSEFETCQRKRYLLFGSSPFTVTLMSELPLSPVATCTHGLVDPEICDCSTNLQSPCHAKNN